MKGEPCKVRQRSSSVSMLVEAVMGWQEGKAGDGLFLPPEHMYSQVEKLRQAMRSQA